jgi:hypothetical protein
VPNVLTRVLGPCLAVAMPGKSIGQARLANRSAVLQLHRQEPDMKATEMGRLLGLNESTVRYIIEVYGSEDISVGAPSTHKGAGRPFSRSERWKRCDLAPFSAIVFMTCTPQAIEVLM